jgi:drug/metabolite transporter (DMT)-like permease
VTLASALAGILLGIVNYYSLVFLVRCLATIGAESALIWAMTNMLVVIFSSVLAFFIFKEKLSRANQLGIGLALLAIFILSR